MQVITPALRGAGYEGTFLVRKEPLPDECFGCRLIKQSNRVGGLGAVPPCLFFGPQFSDTESKLLGCIFGGRVFPAEIKKRAQPFPVMDRGGFGYRPLM